MNIKKYIAECIGTAVLVIFGCGTAVFSAGNLVATAFAFGMSIVMMAYTVGKVSGCHLNPAVSAAMYLDGKMPLKDFLGYIIGQFAGGVIGALTILVIKLTMGYDYKMIQQTGLGANAFNDLNWFGAFLVEVILTFIFILVVFAATENKKTAPHAGLLIGAALFFVHILGINLTGTSVNPARSFGPAIFTGAESIKELWVFIVAPIVGAVIAVIVNKVFIRKDNISEE